MPNRIGKMSKKQKTGNWTWIGKREPAQAVRAAHFVGRPGEVVSRKTSRDGQRLFRQQVSDFLATTLLALKALEQGFFLWQN